MDVTAVFTSCRRHDLYESIAHFSPKMLFSRWWNTDTVAVKVGMSRMLPFEATDYVGKVCDLVGSGKRVLSVGPLERRLRQRLEECGNELSTTTAPNGERGRICDVAVLDRGFESNLAFMQMLERIQPLVDPTGSILLVAVNPMHGQLRLAALQGSYPDFAGQGVASHTKAMALIARAGLEVVRVERERSPLLAGNDLTAALLHENIPHEIVSYLRRDPECETLRFIVLAKYRRKGEART